MEITLQDRLVKFFFTKLNLLNNFKRKKNTVQMPTIEGSDPVRGHSLTYVEEETPISE